MNASTAALLDVHDIETFYGTSQALFKLSFRLEQGEFMTLLGRNGMGKSTTVKSIMGLMTPAHGSIRLMDRDITGLPSHKIARAGVGLVPEGRQRSEERRVGTECVSTGRSR